MRLYRPTVTKNGQKVTVKTWYTDVWFFGGKRCRLPLFKSKEVSSQFVEKLEMAICEYRELGRYSAQTLDWIEGLGPMMKRKLARIGIAFPQQEKTTKMLSDHIEDIKTSLQAAGCTKIYMDILIPLVEKIVKDCAIGQIDLNGSVQNESISTAGF